MRACTAGHLPAPAGTLPAYVNGIIGMAKVALHSNRFSGPIPMHWGRYAWAWNWTINATHALSEL